MDTPPPPPPPVPSSSWSTIEQAQTHCHHLLHHTLPSLPTPSKISSSSKLTLQRLLSSELNFLSSLSPSSPNPNPSLNLSHLSSLISTILHPSLHHISRLSTKPISIHVHVTLICTFDLSPSWFFVSAQNPLHLSVPSLRSRLLTIRAAVNHATPSLRPDFIFFVFAKGVSNDVVQCFVEEFGGGEVDFGFGRVFRMKVGVERDCEGLKGCLEVGDGKEGLIGAGEFGGLVMGMRRDGRELVNFDTTALVAIVSGISNGGCERLMERPEEEMRRRFKSNYEFVIAQVMSELEHPILPELRTVIEGKKGIVCESVCSEFKEIVFMAGGPNEKLRADILIKHLLVVPDRPSERVASLPTTRKIAAKNKVVFGTGDYWHAPTLTANMGFVRAISQIGMSLFTVEHRPRALVGD